jgi:hypothetical protein
MHSRLSIQRFHLLIAAIIIFSISLPAYGRRNLVQSVVVGNEGDILIAHACQKPYFNITGICAAYCPKGACTNNIIIQQVEQTSFNSLQAVVSPNTKLGILLYQNGGSLKALYCNDVTCASSTKTTVRNSGTNDIFAVTIDRNDTLHLAVADYEPMIFYVKYNMQNNYYRRDKTNLDLTTIYDINIQLDPNTTLPIISTIQDSVQIITCSDINCYAWKILQQYGNPSTYDVLAQTPVNDEWIAYFQGCWSGLLVANINTNNYTISYDRQLLPVHNQTCTIEAVVVEGQLTLLVGTQDPINGVSGVRYLYCNAQDCSTSNMQSVLLASSTDMSFTPQVTSTVIGNAVTLFYQNSSSLFAVICASPSCSSYQQYDLYLLTSNPPVMPPTEPPTNPPITPPVEPPVEPPVNPPVEPPVEPPVNPPVKPPVNPPVEPPIEPPVNPPIEPPVNPPVKPPVEPPIAPPVSQPQAPTSEPIASPSEAPTATEPVHEESPTTTPVDQKDSTLDWIISGSIIGAVLILVAVLLIIKFRRSKRLKPADEFQRLLDEPNSAINSQSY